MPWKTNYTISDEIGVADRDIVWPDGNRCCFNVVVDLSLASGPEGLKPSDLTTMDAVFAMGDGLAGLLDVLASHKIVATVAVPAAMAKIYPKAVETVLKRGHEVAAEGLFHEDVSQLSLEDERARMKDATAILSEIIGSRPAGWYDLPRRDDKFAVGAISPHTTKLLRDEGYTYMGNGLADDAPHYSVIDFATATRNSRDALLLSFRRSVFHAVPAAWIGAGESGYAVSQLARRNSQPSTNAAASST